MAPAAKAAFVVGCWSARLNSIVRRCKDLVMKRVIVGAILLTIYLLVLVSPGPAPFRVPDAVSAGMTLFLPGLLLIYFGWRSLRAKLKPSHSAAPEKPFLVRHFRGAVLFLGVFILVEIIAPWLSSQPDDVVAIRVPAIMWAVVLIICIVRAFVIAHRMEEAEKPAKAKLADSGSATPVGFEDPSIYDTEMLSVRRQLADSGSRLPCVVCHDPLYVDLRTVESDIREIRRRQRLALTTGTIMFIAPDVTKGGVCKTCRGVLCGKCFGRAYDNKGISTPVCPVCHHVVEGIDHITD